MKDDFSKCKRGQSLKSICRGEVMFIAFVPEAHYPVICLCGDRLEVWSAGGFFKFADTVPDLTIPPKMKEVKLKAEFDVERKVHSECQVENVELRAELDRAREGVFGRSEKEMQYRQLCCVMRDQYKNLADGHKDLVGLALVHGWKGDEERYQISERNKAEAYELQLKLGLVMFDDPAPSPLPADRGVCVYEQIGRTDEDGNPEVIWRGQCNIEEDVIVAGSLCMCCLRPIQLKGE